jgi:hypothetical protein
MSLIKLSDYKISGRQDKYLGKDFVGKLDVSRELPDITKDAFRKAGFGISERSYDDQAITCLDGDDRFLDIDGINYFSRENFKIECKDFSRFGAHEMIGVPRRYIEEKAIFFNYVIFIFRYNIKVLQSFVNFHKYRNIDEAIQDSLNKGFLSMKDGKIVYTLWGNRLDILLRPENRMIDKEGQKNYVCSDLGKYRGEKQYLFKIDSMLLIDDLIEQEKHKERWPNIWEKYLINDYEF